ncbi:hypothetical protein HAX54_021239 [Datura stramonium]|uniref:Uncharacterized protein n=1 Tax=Datura stramonium TaxID=4076 RepID=A0ABS8UVA4_DATST|nr:hypothetical protein [Datura stramonium]
MTKGPFYTKWKILNGPTQKWVGFLAETQKASHARGTPHEVSSRARSGLALSFTFQGLRWFLNLADIQALPKLGFAKENSRARSGLALSLLYKVSWRFHTVNFPLLQSPILAK